MMSVETIERLVTTQGLAVLIVLATGFAVWRVARFLSPRIDKIIDLHTNFLLGLESSQNETGEKLLVIDRKIDEQGRKIDVVIDSMGKIHDVIRGK